MATAGFNDSGVYALAAYDGDLLVVGGFDTAGINSATNIALWHIPQQLLIQYSNYGLTLSWPASGSNFVLEACRDWANPIWTPLTEEPAVIDGQCIITSTISGKNRFFRLHKH